MQTVDSPSPPLPPPPTTTAAQKAHPLPSHPPPPVSHTTNIFPDVSSSTIPPSASKPVIRPLLLGTSTNSPSVNPASSIAETPPSVIGPSAHLASHVMSHDRPVGHMMSHGVSHDQNDSVFSPTTDEDQMKHIEKVHTCTCMCVSKSAHTPTPHTPLTLPSSHSHPSHSHPHTLTPHTLTGHRGSPVHRRRRDPLTKSHHSPASQLFLPCPLTPRSLPSPQAAAACREPRRLQKMALQRPPGRSSRWGERGACFRRVKRYMYSRGSSFFFGKMTALGVLCCFALLFV